MISMRRTVVLCSTAQSCGFNRACLYIFSSATFYQGWASVSENASISLLFGALYVPHLSYLVMIIEVDRHFRGCTCLHCADPNTSPK